MEKNIIKVNFYSIMVHFIEPKINLFNYLTQNACIKYIFII